MSITVGIDKDQPYKCSNHTNMYAQLAILYDSYNNFFSILLYLATRVSECYTNADCTGNQVAVTNQRQCCVWTNDGLSYSDGSSCMVCRGRSWCENNGVLSFWDKTPPHKSLSPMTPIVRWPVLKQWFPQYLQQHHK